MKRGRIAIAACCTAGLALAVAAPAHAQTSAAWKPTPARVTLDFSPQNRERRATFDKDGAALELDAHIWIVGRDRVTIDAVVPAAGELHVEVVGQSAMKIVPPEDADSGGRADIVSSLAIIGPEEARQSVQREIDVLLARGIKRGLAEASKRRQPAAESFLRERQLAVPEQEKEVFAAFARAWAIENDAQPLVDQLKTLVDKRARWLADNEKSYLLGTKGRQAFDAFLDLRCYDLYDERLHECGLPLQQETGNVRKRLEFRFDAVYLAMSGKPNEKTRGGKGIAEVLSPSDLKKLRQSLTADLKCRFTFATDPADANALWFNAQRIACRNAGPAIKVSGRLAPDNHDRTDWWRLEPWKPGQATLVLPKLPAVQWEQYAIDGGLLLRVVSIEQLPVDYQFELRPAGKSTGEASIVIHETPSNSEAKFPF